MSNLDPLAKASAPASPAKAPASLAAGEGGQDVAPLFDGLFALMRQAGVAAENTGGPVKTDAVQNALSAAALYMSLAPVDTTSSMDMDGIPDLLSTADTDGEGADRLTRLLLAAADIMPDDTMPLDDGAVADPARPVASAESVLLIRAIATQLSVTTDPTDAAAAPVATPGSRPAGLPDIAAQLSSLPDTAMPEMALPVMENPVVDITTAGITDPAMPETGMSETGPSNTGVPVVGVQTVAKKAAATPDPVMPATAPVFGPQPLTDSTPMLFGRTVAAHQVLARPAPEFVGPMPQPLHHHQPAPAFAQHLPASEMTWQIMDPPSPSFIGPMPAVAKPQVMAAMADGLTVPDGTAKPDRSGVVSPDPMLKTARAAKLVAGTIPASSAAVAGHPQAMMTAAAAAADATAQSGLAVAVTGEQTRTVRAYADPASSASTAGTTAASEGVVTGAGAGGQSSSGGGQGGGGQHQSAFAADLSSGRDTSARMVVHRLNTLQTGWAGTMVRQLETGLHNGTHAIRIILQPGNLGRLNIDLGLKNGAANIRVGAETAEAAQLLKGARHHLSQMLEQSGMRLAGLQTVSAGGDGGAQAGLGQGHHGQQQTGGENGGRKQALSNKIDQPDRSATGLAEPSGPDGVTLREGEMAVLSILA